MNITLQVALQARQLQNRCKLTPVDLKPPLIGCSHTMWPDAIGKVNTYTLSQGQRQVHLNVHVAVLRTRQTSCIATLATA